MQQSADQKSSPMDRDEHYFQITTDFLESYAERTGNSDDHEPIALSQLEKLTQAQREYVSEAFLVGAVELHLEGTLDEYWPVHRWLRNMVTPSQDDVTIDLKLPSGESLVVATKKPHRQDLVGHVNVEWDRAENALLAFTYGTGNRESRRSEQARHLMSPAATCEYQTTVKTRCLVVCNAYPSEQQIYRNGFIHTRVTAYIASGIDVEVYYLHPPARESYVYTYEGVRVTVGNPAAYAEFVRSIEHDMYLIHFSNPDMLTPLESYRSNIPRITWIHGFESEAWHRRWFNFLGSSAEIAAALEKKSSHYDKQQMFNHGQYRDPADNEKFVNVSNWFKKSIVEPDAGVALSNDEVIPNLIDPAHYSFVPKTSELRYRVLSIRPYASHKYANDLTAEAIRTASTRPWFNKFQFTICGSGRDFEMIAGPLRKYSNVKLVNRFLNSREIKELHDRHGLLMTPTRFDSQGVSAGEAMASGLVPLSTNIAAIPEFIEHEQSGLLGRPENHNDLVQFLERIHYDPELFQHLSLGAADKVRTVAGPENTIHREIRMIEEMMVSSVD